MKSIIPILLVISACTSDDRGPGRAPPTDWPWLADVYDVQVDLLANSCAPGGFEPVALPAVASVWQDGSKVEWRQETAAENGDFWYLTGALCAREGGHVLRLAGGRRDTVEGCQVRASLPAEGFDAKADPCTAPGYLEFAFEEDGCGGLRLPGGPVAARLTYQRACAWRRPCELTLGLKAVPAQADPRAPARPEGCR